MTQSTLSSSVAVDVASYDASLPLADAAVELRDALGVTTAIDDADCEFYAESLAVVFLRDNAGQDRDGIVAASLPEFLLATASAAIAMSAVAARTLDLGHLRRELAQPRDVQGPCATTCWLCERDGKTVLPTLCCSTSTTLTALGCMSSVAGALRGSHAKRIVKSLPATTRGARCLRSPFLLTR